MFHRTFIRFWILHPMQADAVVPNAGQADVRELLRMRLRAALALKLLHEPLSDELAIGVSGRGSQCIVGTGFSHTEIPVMALCQNGLP